MKEFDAIFRLSKKNTLQFFLWFALFLSCVLLFGCRERNEQYFLSRGEGVQREIAEALSDAFTLRDLLQREEHLTQLFLELSSLAIQADRWKKTYRGKKETSPVEGSETHAFLEKEFRRVLTIPGAKAFLEKCQKPALDALDIYLAGVHKTTS